MDITKHPLLDKAYRLCLQIEMCGASEALTKASEMASELMSSIDHHLDNHKCRTCLHVRGGICQRHYILCSEVGGCQFGYERDMSE